MKREKREFVVLLDNIRSLYNVGSIFRTADGLGFQKIYLGGWTPAPEGGRQKSAIHKTALGAEERIPWEKASSLSRLINHLQKEGYYILALETEKEAVSLERIKLPKNKQKIALLLGNEVEGLKKSLLKKCHCVVKIPMAGSKESYNVSVAFGIAGFWLKKTA